MSDQPSEQASEFAIASRVVGIPPAIIQGLRDGSLVAVPREPTDAMLHAASFTLALQNVAATWRRMLAAAPAQGGGE
jgi:hypothetical protein